MRILRGSGDPCNAHPKAPKAQKVRVCSERFPPSSPRPPVGSLSNQKTLTGGTENAKTRRPENAEGGNRDGKCLLQWTGDRAKGGSRPRIRKPACSIHRGFLENFMTSVPWLFVPLMSPPTYPSRRSISKRRPLHQGVHA